MKLVAVTSCITGIAHTYRAAAALEQAAKKAGHELVVETQGAAGSSPLSAATLAEAKAAIFAVDLEVKGRNPSASAVRAYLDARDAHGRTAIHLSASGGHAALFEALIERRAAGHAVDARPANHTSLVVVLIARPLERLDFSRLQFVDFLISEVEPAVDLS